MPRTSSPGRIAIADHLDCFISIRFRLKDQRLEKCAVSFILGESSAFLILTRALSLNSVCICIF